MRALKGADFRGKVENNNSGEFSKEISTGKSCRFNKKNFLVVIFKKSH
jgi:hypothetical protein